MNEDSKDAAGLTFEQALQDLEDLVVKLEKGKLPLDQSLELFEHGQQLAQHCNTLLDEAELRVKQIATGSGDDSLLMPQTESEG